MSDSWIHLASADPLHVPPEGSIARAEQRLRETLGAADEIAAHIEPEPVIIDAGVNTESVRCPRCRTELGVRWLVESIGSWMEQSAKTECRLLVPCCGSKEFLHDLDMDWPWAFSRFRIEVMNPDIAQIPQPLLTEIQTLLGCDLRVVYQHL